MTINGVNGANTQTGQMGMNPATDSYSRNLQNQIANAQKQLQELSSNEKMTLEEKMKKRQEIQQQISDLNMQLRQHQMEQRRAAMGGSKKQAKNSSTDNRPGGTDTKAQGKSTGLSQAGMTALISADLSMKQAKAQGSAAKSMEGRAGVLESEIKNNHGANVEKKTEELADVTQKAQAATLSQMNTLAEANKAVKEAAATECGNNEKASGEKEEKTEKAAPAEGKIETAADGSARGEKAQGGIYGTDVQTENPRNARQANGIQPAGIADPEMQAVQPAAYNHVDVRL